MESMRNLHRSLPRSTPQHKSSAPPEDLLQTFKAAALSVTSLYKRAAEELSAERNAGYQDAVYDLLSFLDRENIGLETGEGWRIRQWATERQESGPESHNSSGEEEDDKEEDSKDYTTAQAADGGENTPQGGAVGQGAAAAVSMEAEMRSTATDTSSSNAMSPQPERQQPSSCPQPPQAEAFTFRSHHSYPESLSSGPDAVSPTTPRHHQHQHQHQHHQRSSSTTRPSRRNPQLPRQLGRPRHLGPGAGSKRKVHLSDFFDLGSLNFGKEPPGHAPKQARQ